MQNLPLLVKLLAVREQLLAVRFKPVTLLDKVNERPCEDKSNDPNQGHYHTSTCAQQRASVLYLLGCLQKLLINRQKLTLVFCRPMFGLPEGCATYEQRRNLAGG